jgi:hypothetical protein
MGLLNRLFHWGSPDKTLYAFVISFVGLYDSCPVHLIVFYLIWYLVEYKF